jgi:hypothetical protein
MRPALVLEKDDSPEVPDLVIETPEEELLPHFETCMLLSRLQDSACQQNRQSGQHFQTFQVLGYLIKS